MTHRLLLAAATVWIVAAPEASPQISLAQGSGSRYDRLYGTAVEVSVEDLLRHPMSYDRRTVRTSGRLNIAQGGGSDRFFSLGDFGRTVLIIPVSEVGFEFDSQAPSWVGRKVEITGVFHAGSTDSTLLSGGDPSYIQFWRFMGPPEPDRDARPTAAERRREQPEY